MTVEPVDIDYGLSLLRARQRTDKLYNDYYFGRFDLSYVPTDVKPSLVRLLRRAKANRCRPVVDALADRVSIVGWDLAGAATTPTAGTPATSDPVVQHAADVWRRTRMANRQNEVFKESFRAGDAYLIVWPDDLPGSPTYGKACFYPNRAHTTIVVYDDEYPDRVAFALKCWQVDRGLFKGRWRLTVYETDQITRWITATKPDRIPERFDKFAEYAEDGSPVTDNPYGVVPVFHFGNDADTGGYGTSELADVVGLQDGLNNSVCRTVIAEEFASFPQKWVVGFEPEEDPTNPGAKKSPFQLAADKLLWVADVDAKFGQFEAANMQQILSVRDAWSRDVATVSRTPLHWFDGAAAGDSGEKLRVSEAPFTSKATDRIGSFTDPASQAMRLALQIEGDDSDAVAGIEPTWMSVESRSEQEKWTIAGLQQIAGVPDEQIWSEAGYSPDQIAEMLAMKDRAMARSGLTTPFDQGGQQNQQNQQDQQGQQMMMQGGMNGG